MNLTEFLGNYGGWAVVAGIAALFFARLSDRTRIKRLEQESHNERDPLCVHWTGDRAPFEPHAVCVTCRATHDQKRAMS